ncbi:MAG: metallophosphoesterase [Holophaga sp.]|nr:metallophosphoesterase [Holophaga sp.]
MERRAFIQSMGAALLASRLPLRAGEGPARITLLHTNDTHSRIEPFGPGNGALTGRGGIARRATLVRQIRRDTPNVLLLDAGDVFQGTPYFNQYKGFLDFKLMSMCGYDAGTLGNHDFDNGVEGLVAAMAEARFPIVNCNLDAGGAPALASRLQPWTVKRLPGITVGITGVCVDFQGLVSRENHAGVVWRDPVRALGPVVERLRAVEKVDLVVLLSHLGYDRQGEAIDDLNLARRVPGLDVILGGHTHTFMEAPVRVGETEIFQVGFAGVNLGRMDLALRDGVKLACSGMAIPVPGGCAT